LAHAPIGPSLAGELKLFWDGRAKSSTCAPIRTGLGQVDSLLDGLLRPSSTPKAEFERFSRPGANVINKLALQRQFFCSGTV
jgi:hypothetical protein